MSGLAADLAAAADPVAFAAGFGFVAEPWQERLLRSRSRRVLVACARQVGKTHTTTIRAVHTAVYRPGSLVLLISPSQRQSDEMLRRCREVYRVAGRPVSVKAESSSTLELGNGSRIVSLPGTEGTTRGFAGARLLILDEAARVSDDVFVGVLPMVASDGAIWALSTPWGQRGWFYEMHVKPGAGWQKHKITAYESARYEDWQIAELRDSTSSYEFASDYECSFEDTDSQLFRTADIRAAYSDEVAPLFIDREGER